MRRTIKLFTMSITAVAFLTLILLTGCKQGVELTTETTTVTEQVSTTQDALATKQFIIEHFNITESDLEGIDVEGVIEYFQITQEGIISSSDVVAKLKMLEEQMNTEIGNGYIDFSYIFEGNTSKDAIEVDSIKYIAFSYGQNDSSKTYIIDVLNSQYCSAIGDISFCNLHDEDALKMLESARLDDILKCVADAHVENWKASYEGNNGDTTGSEGWKLGIELKDNAVYSYSGYGMFGENAPAELNTIKQSICELD